MKRLLKKLSAGLVVAALTVGMAFSSFAVVSGDTNCSLAGVLKEIDNYADDKSYSEMYKSAQDTWNNFSDSGTIGIGFNGVTKMFANTADDDSNGTLDENYKKALDAMNAHLTLMKGKSTNTNSVDYAADNLDNINKSLGIEADIDNAVVSLESLTPLVSTATGLIVVITLLGMAIFTAFDVAYLVFPVAKSAMDNAGSSGNRSVSKTDGKTGEVKFRWVTDDAINAYQQSADTGKNPLMCYLTKRIWSYVAVAIVVYILMSGNITVIIKFVLNILESVFGMLGGLSVG